MALEEHLCEGQQPRIRHCWGISSLLMAQPCSPQPDCDLCSHSLSKNEPAAQPLNDKVSLLPSLTA